MGMALTYLTVSYDIACQWSRNLQTRIPAFPVDMQLSFWASIVRFFVPKFHLSAHGEKCQGPYSLNWQPGVGRTDGEGIERSWSWLNDCARSLSMMTAGARWDTMDDFANFSNYRKMVGSGALIYLDFALHV